MLIASARAASSMIPPRAVLMIRSPALRVASKFAPDEPDVSGVFGRWTVMKSASATSSSSASISTFMCLARSGGHVGVVRAQGASRKREARCATSAPTLPSPTIPRVLPWSSTPSHFDLSHLPATRALVRLGNVPRLREQQGEGVLGRRQDVRLRRVHDHHPETRGGCGVDVVETDAGPADNDQIASRLEHLGGHLGRGADDESVRRPDRLDQVLRQTGPTGPATSCPASRMSSRPRSASFSVTRMRAICQLAVAKSSPRRLTPSTRSSSASA